jgi:GNAT superfamily N-acetyltransferase
VKSSSGDRGIANAVLVRSAAVADARAIAEIVVRGWRAAYRGILPDDFLDGLSVDAREIAWRMRLAGGAEGGGPVWVAELDAKAIGFVSTGPPRDEDMQPSHRLGVPTGAEIHAIYVAPEAWRKGAGRALLTTAVDHWRGGDVAILVLWVLEENDVGRAFYEAMGWRPDGARQLLDLGGLAVPEVRYRLTY